MDDMETAGLCPNPSRPTNLADLLDRLKGKCITVRLVSGEEITGFNRGVVDGVLLLFVSGTIVFVVIDKIEAFAESKGC